MMINTKTIITYWKEGADNCWKVANNLYKLKHYSEALFFCHLALEKLLKGLVVQHTHHQAPYIHNLVRLAQSANIPLEHNQVEDLEVIANFNIAGRYESIKLALHRKAKKTYTEQYLATTKHYYQWLKKKYQKA